MSWEKAGKQASVLTVNGSPDFKVQWNSQFSIINQLYVLGDVIFFFLKAQKMGSCFGSSAWFLRILQLSVRTMCSGLCFQTLFLSL